MCKCVQSAYVCNHILHCLYHTVCAGCYAIKMFKEIIKKRTKVVSNYKITYADTYVHTNIHTQTTIYIHAHMNTHACKRSARLLVCVSEAKSLQLLLLCVCAATTTLFHCNSIVQQTTFPLIHMYMHTIIDILLFYYTVLLAIL